MLIRQHEDLRNPLEFQKKIWKIQSESNDTAPDCSDQATIVELQKRSLETKKPMIQLLDPSMFDIENLSKTAKKIAEVFIEREIDRKGMKEFIGSLGEGRINLSELVKATLKEDAASIKKTAETLNLDPARLLYLISILIQPCLEDIARKTDPSLLDNWWQASCPVCGRTPAVAKMKNRKRYLVCTFCGTEYLSDSFLCVHCGNRDPYTLKFLNIAELPAFQIDFCTKCKHYVKVIDETGLKENIPSGLEDVLTLHVDLIAKKVGLVREYS
jgi:FdhE protein